MENGITIKVKGENAYYFVHWSPLALADRWHINSKVPAVGGIYEIYWMDDQKHLRLFQLGNTHYGGLRSEIRRLTDGELVYDSKIRQILETKEIWFRYAETDSVSAMADTIWFFRKVYFPDDPGTEPSGLYRDIFLKESAPDKLIWVP